MEPQPCARAARTRPCVDRSPSGLRSAILHAAPLATLLALSCGGTGPSALPASPLPARAVEVARRLDGPDDPTRSVSLAGDTRPALVGPARWELTVPRDEPARLRAAVALLSGREACFGVRVDGENADQRCVRTENAWESLEIALPATGAASRIELEATGDPGAWGDPVVIPQREDPRADVVLVILDTTRWDHFGAAGYAARSTTPALDAFLRTAALYTNARSPSPWTAPAIASMLTGLLPTRHGAGLRTSRVFPPDATAEERKLLSYAALRPDVPTLATLLRARGYDTVALSANGFFSSNLGFDVGYGRFESYSAKGWDGAQRGVTRAKEVLAGRGDLPLFLTLHLVDPHHPYTMRLPPREGYAVPTELTLTKSGTGRRRMVSVDKVDEAAQRHPEALQVLYDAEIRWMDEALASLLARIPDDALVVVVADHGEAFGEHGHFIHGNSMYDEVLRVPLFVRFPGGAHAGAVELPVTTLSVQATVLDALGLPAAGRRLPRPGEAAEEAPILSEAIYSGPDRSSLVEEGWKYIYTHPAALPAWTGREARIGSEELYDLAADPGERDDLAAAEPARLARMRAAVRAHLSRSWPGLHVRCSGAVRFGARGLTRVSPIDLETEDRLALEDGRLDAALTGDDGDELVLQAGSLGATIVFDGEVPAGVSSVTLGRGELPTAPPSEPSAGCQVWEADATAPEPALDEETLKNLELLGYVGGG